MDITKIFEIQCCINDEVIFSIDTSTLSEYMYQEAFEKELDTHMNKLKNISQHDLKFMMRVQTPTTITWVRSDRLYLMYLELLSLQNEV
jgi:hypothetical protein